MSRRPFNDVALCRCGWPELSQRPVTFSGGLRVVFSIMGGVSAVHMMGQQVMGAGVRSGSVTEDDASCSQSIVQDQQPCDGKECEMTEVEAVSGDGFETPREGIEMPREVGDHGSVSQLGTMCGSDGAQGTGTGEFAHVSAPDHAPAGKRSTTDAPGLEGERSVRRKKFGVFLDHGVLESVKNGDPGQDGHGSKDRLEAGVAAGSGSSSAIDALMSFKGSQSTRSPPSSESSVGSVGNSIAAAGGSTGTTGPSAGSPRAGTPPGNCLSPLLVKRKFSSLHPTVTTVGKI